jgi:hypothetical protein
MRKSVLVRVAFPTAALLLAGVGTLTSGMIPKRASAGGIVCVWPPMVGQATVPQPLVATTGGHANAKTVQLLQPGPDDTRVRRTDRHARLGGLQNWIDNHPVKGMIVKAAVTLGVLVAVQLLVQPSHAVIHADSVSAKLRRDRHHRRSDRPA